MSELTDDNRELAPLNIIRNETAVSRYPLHKLSKGTENFTIEITRMNELGEVSFKWDVSYNNKYGQPGPLAYKIDTLVINRRIEEAERPVPKNIRLGSLREIASELGLGGDTSLVKKALYQNASAFITAKIRYVTKEKRERTAEFGKTRYGVLFAGEELADGTTADAVYIELNDWYRDIINTAKTRPLDYDYLRELPPTAQRLYELLSFRVFAALKNGRDKARYLYSDFCAFAPQTRYFEYDKVKKQMYKVHAPHKNAGYIVKAELEPTTDDKGNPDWLMLYTPGPKAKREFSVAVQQKVLPGSDEEGMRAFIPKTKKTESKKTRKPENQQSTEKKAISAKEQELLTSLLSFKVEEGKARELVDRFPERVEQELEAWPHREKGSVKDPASWIIRAIERGNYSQPSKVEAKRQQKAAVKKQKSREETRKQLMSEYHIYLRQELQDLEANHTEWHEHFFQEFEQYWKLVCRDLSNDKRELMSLHFLEKYAEEHPDVQISLFDQWANKEYPGVLAK
jgi:hypothetical protein